MSGAPPPVQLPGLQSLGREREGLVVHQAKNPKKHMTIDSVADFRELTDIKIEAGTTGLLMIGGGVPKNFAQDTVVCAEILGKEVDMHKYAVQITVADTRDGACSSSTLKEACSWGKVDTAYEQMVYAEASSVLPLLASDAYQCGYCTPGQIMSATALMKEPCGLTDAAVKEAMSGNICRCGAYVNILEAIQTVRKAS